MTYSVSETFYLTRAIWRLMNFDNVVSIPFERLILLVCPKTERKRQGDHTWRG